MKFLFILILFMIVISFTSFSYAQIQTSLENGLFISVQSELRDSNGQLISYLESSKFVHLDLVGLHNFLDFETTVGNDPIISIDDKNYQVIQRTKTLVSHFDTVIGSTSLSDNFENRQILLANYIHDGFPVVSGDTLSSTWTFIRLL